MIELNKSNVAAYAASRLDFFQLNKKITVSCVGGGSIEEDGVRVTEILNDMLKSNS